MKTVLAISTYLLALTLVSCEEAFAESPFPSVDELPIAEKLPDPFQFFESDRKVKNQEDWKERRDEILRMLQHYVSGPAFSQTHNAKLVDQKVTKVYSGKAIHYDTNLAAGPNHSIRCRFEFVRPAKEGPCPILIYICPRKEYSEETLPWREEIIDRGYAFALIIPGQFNGYEDDGQVKEAFPKVKGNTMMAWVWGINEVVHYLENTYKTDKVIIIGTSRFGKTAAMVGVMNERIDLTVPVTGGFGVRRFNIRDQKQPASAFIGRCWSNDVFPTFAGQLNKLPVDQHLVGSLIAPRGLLAIMGDENEDKNVGHIKSYEALVPVYQWLGAKEKLKLHNHSPRGHGIGKGDFFTALDFADRIFYAKQPKRNIPKEKK